MNTSTAHRLLRLNRSFYDGFAGEFSDSRRVLQPGILRALGSLGPYNSMLDLGCGDGRVMSYSLHLSSAGCYLGVDYSSEMLSIATGSTHSQAFLVQADLASPGWSHRFGRNFDVAACFSVLHHIPGPRRRLRLLRETRSLLRPGARLAISVWRFRHVPRLLQKIVPWEEIGLATAAVDSGDYLLDWQRGGRGLRYVHHFDEAELANMCQSAGFAVVRTYRSDGETGDMGLYMICEV